MEQKYNLVKVLKRTNKEKNADYYLAYVVLSNENSCDLINILVSREQAEYLKKFEMNKDFDIGKCIQLEYNSYQKNIFQKLY